MTSATSAVAVVAEPPVPAAAAEPVRVRFVGNRRDFWRLMIRGNALQAATLGFYRFWMFSDMRRFMWAGIEIEDENFEYIGTAGELLIGFLMALGILIPVNLVVFYAVLEIGPLAQSTIVFVVLFAFTQFAAFRARAYRLTRTVLRGLRFHQTGSGIVFALRALAWWIVVLLTLGLAFPFHGGVEPGALQDAPHLLRRSRRPVRGNRLAAADARHRYVDHRDRTAGLCA